MVASNNESFRSDPSEQRYRPIVKDQVPLCQVPRALESYVHDPKHYVKKTEVLMCPDEKQRGQASLSKRKNSYMAKPRFSIMLLLVLLVVVESVTTAVASAASVNIYSEISRGPPLQVHCRLGNIVDALKWTTVQYGEHVGWGFKPNFWGTTKYNCEFRSGDRTQAFDVWVDDFFLSIWRRRPCKQCEWYVDEQGFFRKEAGGPYLLFK